MNNDIEPGLTSENIFTAPSQFDAPDEPQTTMHGSDTSIMRFPDGTAVVGPQEDEQAQFPNRMNPNQHNENLALVLEESELRDIGNSLKHSIEEDIESQEEFYEAVAKIIEYLGLNLTSEADKEDLPFKGAASIYSPAMFESALDLVASAKNAIFPATGMVDTVILGEAADHLQDIAYRKKAFFNYYFDSVAKEFRKEAIRTIFWAVLAGSAYKKVYICPVLGRPVSNFIPVEDFIVNREHSSHMAASRKTHILRINERELQIRVMTGMYRDTKIMKQEDNTSGTEVIKEKLDQISGFEKRHNQEDAGYTIYECHIDYRIKGDTAGSQYDIPLPYIISIDEKSGNVLRIARNWKENDFLKTKKEYFVNYSLLPSLDGEGYGLVNYAGRLAEAATSLTRQLINAGCYATFPGGIYQSGIRMENNNLRPAPGEFVPIQTGGIPVDQAVSALPYKEPSPALHELKNEIEDNIRKPSAIVNQKITDMAPRAPQGSVLAMLENLQKVPNAIMQNFHESFTRELELFNDRFAEWLPENQPYPFMVPGGKHVIMKDDFDADIQVLPSSDPSTQNATHRFMLSEIVINNAKESPDIHNMEYAFKFFYKNLGLSEENINRLLSPKDAEKIEPPQPMDPVSTIMAITNGQPVEAAVWQDHDAYMTIIDLWIQTNQDNPNLPAATALKAKHAAFKYLVDVYAKLNMPPPEDPSQLTPEQQNQLAVAVAQIKQQEAEQAAAAAGAPPEPPLDPAKVMLEDSHLKNQIAHEKNELESKKLDLEDKKMQMDFALKEQEFNLKSQIQTLKQNMDEQKMQHDQILRERDQVLQENSELQNRIQQEYQPQK